MEQTATVAAPTIERPKEKPFVTFVLLGEGRWTAFQAYEDEYGQAVFRPHKRDHKGEPIPYPKDSRGVELFPYVQFKDAALLVQGSDTELLEFVRNSPWCLGSKLQIEGGYPPEYKEVDEEGDAQRAFDRTQTDMEALNAVVNMPADQLRMYAISLAGCTDLRPVYQRNALTAYAKTHPEKFLTEIKGGGKSDAVIAAHVKWAISTGTCVQAGTNGIIKLAKGGEIIGNGLDEAIAYLQANTEMRKYFADLFKKGK